MDYERFLEELEEDPEMRAKVALYKDPTYVARPREEDTMTETDGEEPPQVPLEELLDELTLEGGGRRRGRGDGGIADGFLGIAYGQGAELMGWEAAEGAAG